MAVVSQLFERAQRWEQIVPARYELGPFCIDRATYDRHIDLHGAPWAGEFKAQCLEAGIVPLSLLQAFFERHIANSNILCSLTTTDMEWRLRRRDARPIHAGEPLLLELDVRGMSGLLKTDPRFGVVETFQRVFTPREDHHRLLAFRKVDYAVLREGAEPTIPHGWFKDQNSLAVQATPGEIARLGSIIEPGKA